MSLTHTAKTFRKGVRILGIVMFLYYLAILFVIPQTKNLILELLTDRNPPVPKYGLLPPLAFEPIKILNQKPQYVLSTKDGRLPAGMPKKMVVYRHKNVQYSYLASKRAQQDAATLGFYDTELISDLKGSNYTWRSLNSGGTLNINIDTGAISLITDLYGRSGEYVPGSIDYNSAKDHMAKLLTNLGRFNGNIYKNENMKVSLGVFGPNDYLTETKVPAEAQIARVDLFGMIDNYPIMSPHAGTGIISGIIRNPSKDASPYNNPQFIGYFWDLANEKDSTYPIISVSEAWKQITNNKGIISDVTPKGMNPFGAAPELAAEKVLINKIYLAYYETPTFQKYLQPIYVFEGNYVTVGTDGGSIVIYYPAVTAQFTGQPEKTLESTLTPQPTTK